MSIRLTLTALATGIAVLTTPTFAGGPVLTTEEPRVTEARPSSEGNWVLPVIVGLIILGAIAGGGSSDVCNGPEDTPTPTGGC